MAKKARTWAGIGTAMVLSSIIAGCGTSSPSANASAANITVWDIATGPAQQLIQNQTNQFNQSHPNLHATVEFFQNNPYKQKLQIAMGAHNPPDIFFNWGGGVLQSYVAAHDVYNLTPALNADPAWKNKYLPSMWSAVTFKGKIYGVPSNFVQPELFNYNKAIFAEYHLTPPTTWPQLLTDIHVLKSHNVIPIALAGESQWPELIWEEYLVDRVGGPQAFDAVLADKPNAWSNPAFIQANTMIQQLVKDGAFEPGFSAVGYTAGGSDALVYTGKAAMQLMGSWDYQNIQASDPAYINQGHFGWFAFPAVPGGKGNPADVAGNLSNYYSIAANSKNPQAAITYLKSVPLNSAEVHTYIQLGDVPPVFGISPLLTKQPDGNWLTYIYNMTANAPHFQLSWDQALPPAEAQALLTNLSELFLNQITPQQFSQNMNQYLK